MIYIEASFMYAKSWLQGDGEINFQSCLESYFAQLKNVVRVLI